MGPAFARLPVHRGRPRARTGSHKAMRPPVDHGPTLREGGCSAPSRATEDGTDALSALQQ